MRFPRPLRSSFVAASVLALATSGSAQTVRDAASPSAHAPLATSVPHGAPPTALSTPAALGTGRPAILLTGYWPPSNEAVRRFSPSATQNPLGWIGSDWEGRGYDVYSYFPEFVPATCTSCGSGSGDLMVDYQDSSNDFWAIANALQPIAIVTFSRTNASQSWELETNTHNHLTWGADYIAPTQPTPAPADASVPAEALRTSQLPMQAIVNDVQAAGLGLNPFICVLNHAGGFVSEFIGYHGLWYQDLHKSPTDPAWCITAGHIHVGSGVTWANARTAAEITVRRVILHVDGVRNANGAAFCAGDGTLADHTTPCPCGNDGAAGRGCGHSFDPNGARLDANGGAAQDLVVLGAGGMPSSAFTLFLQHDTAGDQVFHDGVLCAGGALVRLRGRSASAGAASFPNSTFAQDATTTLSQRGGVTPGSGVRRYYSAWYRNASTTFCPPATANVTNGFYVDW